MRALSLIVIVLHRFLFLGMLRIWGIQSFPLASNLPFTAKWQQDHQVGIGAGMVVRSFGVPRARMPKVAKPLIICKTSLLANGTGQMRLLYAQFAQMWKKRRLLRLVRSAFLSSSKMQSAQNIAFAFDEIQSFSPRPRKIRRR